MTALQPSTNSNTPALSLKTESSHFFLFAIFSVAARMYVLNIEFTSFFFLPFLTVIFALNILCLQCSDQVCARHSSSASVGRRGAPDAFRCADTPGSEK